MQKILQTAIVEPKVSWFHKVHHVQSYPCVRLECQNVNWDVRYEHPQVGFITGKMSMFSDVKHGPLAAHEMQRLWVHMHNRCLEMELAQSIVALHVSCGSIHKHALDKNEPYSLYMDFAFDAYVNNFQEAGYGTL